MQIIDCEQGGPEWFAARAGIPTASEFSTVMAKGEGKTRKTYMLKLAGEIITGEPMASYSNGDMERGKLLEVDARNCYALMTDNDPEVVGFIKNFGAGASPDSLIGKAGGLEIKCALPHIQIERIMADALPSEHKGQVQGCMWIAEREWWDFVSYSSDKLPLFVKRVYRDEEYIKKLADEVERFNADLAAMVETIRKYGQQKEAA